MAARLNVALMMGLLLGSSPGLARPVTEAQRQEQLSRYEVVLISEPQAAGGLRHRAMGLFDASAEEIFRIATSYERYSEYMPRIVASHVVSQGSEHALVTLEAALPWPMSNLWVLARYQTDAFLDDNDRQAYRVRFSMVRGNLLRYEGLLLIEPYGEGRATVTYELVAEPDTRMPRSWVQRSVGRGVSNFVNFLRARVSQCHRLMRASVAGELCTSRP